MYFRDFHTVAEADAAPKVHADAVSFAAEQVKAGAKLRATINATYSGYLLNRRVYPGRFMREKDCWGSWCTDEGGGVATFNKPILTHHDSHGEPIGRVVAAKFVQLLDEDSLMRDFKNPATEYDQGSGYIQVVGMITDTEAIEKILDGRYNTVSSGQSSPDIWCSICGQNLRDDLCEHRPGKTYEIEGKDKERVCYLITGKLTYHELSYVNMPANRNAVTIASELADKWDGEHKDRMVSCGAGANYEGLCIMDNDGNEVDLFGDDLPATKTQVQGADIASDVDLDELTKAADIDLTPAGSFLTDEVFALGNMVRSMLDAGVLEDGPMSNMISWFKAITDKTNRHQHILYLELDIGKRRLQGGTEYTSKGESHYHSVDLPVEDLNIRTFSGETRDANMGDHHTHKFSFDMMEDLNPMVSMADALEAARLVDEHLQDGKLTRHQFLSLVPSEKDRDTIQKLVDEGVIDAELSAAQRKKLPDSAFCGPDRSFPVPDCAHVTAARRLIGRYKGSAEAKSRIMSCANRKAKKMGCDKENGDAVQNPYGMLFEEDTMDPKNKKKQDPAPHKDEGSKTVRDELKALKPEALLDKAVELSESADAKDRQILKLTDEKDALEQQNTTLEETHTRITDENTKLREDLHKAKARQLVTARMVTGDLAFESEEDYQAKVDEYAERTAESLEDALKDAFPAFQKALKDGVRRPEDFLKDKSQEKDPTTKNGDPTNDKDALKSLKDEGAEKPVEDRKAKRAEEL